MIVLMLKLLTRFLPVLCVLALAGLVTAAAAGQYLSTAQFATLVLDNTYTDLYLFDADRHLNINLTRHPDLPDVARRAVFYNPDHVMVWSPDGERLAYLSQMQSYFLSMLNIRGGFASLLEFAPEMRGIEWSPDGKMFGYLMWNGRGYRAMRAPVDEPEAAVPLHTMDTEDRQLRWNPVHNQIALISGSAIYLLDLDRPHEAPRLLTPDNLLPIGFDWSPDGTRIVLAANTFTPGVIFTELYLIDIESGELTPFGIRNPAGTLYDVNWSPDGKRIAFVSNHAEPGLALWVWTLDEPFARVVTDRSFSSITAPDWSPDSQRIIFSGFNARSYGSQLFIVNADGTGLRPVTGFAGRVWAPRWRP